MRVVLACIVIALTACASQPRCTIDVPRPANPPPFLWRAERPGGGVLWLYGTIHHGGRELVPAAAWQALAASPRFVSELGTLEPDPDKLAEHVKLPSGKGLDQLLPADDWYDLRDTLRGFVREDDLERMRPWYAMSRLTAKLGPSPSPAMDVALADHARDRGLAVEHLETWEEQLAVLAGSVTVDDLREAIHSRRTMRCELDGMLAFYATGDLAAMEKLLGGAANEALLAARNRKWLPALERHAADGGAFVAVGVGHMVGTAGLPALLAHAGYRVERQHTGAASGSARGNRPNKLATVSAACGSVRVEGS